MKAPGAEPRRGLGAKPQARTRPSHGRPGTPRTRGQAAERGTRSDGARQGWTVLARSAPRVRPREARESGCEQPPCAQTLREGAAHPPRASPTTPNARSQPSPAQSRRVEATRSAPRCEETGAGGRHGAAGAKSPPLHSPAMASQPRPQSTVPWQDEGPSRAPRGRQSPSSASTPVARGREARRSRRKARGCPSCAFLERRVAAATRRQ